jgi:MFS family permease
VADSLEAARPASRRTFVAAAMAIGCLQTMAYGTLYYPFAVLKQPMADSGIDSRLLLAAVSGAFLVGGLLAPYVGRTIDRWDGRKVMALGTISGGLACAVMGFTEKIALLLPAVVLLGIAFASTLYDSAFSTIVRIVPRDGRTAITLITLVAGFASTIFWPLTHWLESRIGWQPTWHVYAFLNIAIAAPAYLLLPVPSRSSVSIRDRSQRVADERPQSHQSRVFVLLAFVFSVNALVAATLSIQIIDLLQRAGLAAVTAVSAAALIGPAQVAGRLAEFLLRRNVRPPATAVFALTCLPIALILLLITDSYAMAAGFALMYGMSNGLVTIVKGALPLSLFGSDGYGTLMGRLASPQLIAESLAPFVSAVAIVWLGDQVSISILLALACLSVAAMLMLIASRPTQSDR